MRYDATSQRTDTNALGARYDELLERRDPLTFRLMETLRNAAPDLDRLWEGVANLDERQANLLVDALLDRMRLVDRGRLLSAAAPGPPSDSLAQLPVHELAHALSSVRITLVLTAHPSEMRPPATLVALANIGDALIVQADQESITEDFTAAVAAFQAACGERIAIERPTVGDEVDTLVDHFQRTLFDAIADHRERFDSALARIAPEQAPAPAMIRFHSWVGGDRDGNPNVTAAETLRAAACLREAALRHYREAILAIAAALDRDRGVSALRAPLHELVQLLDAVRVDVSQSVLADPTALHARVLDCCRIAEDAKDRRSADALRRLAYKVEVFGFHTATLEWRDQAQTVLEAFADLYALRNPDEPPLSTLSANQRRDRIAASLEAQESFPSENASTRTRELLGSLAAIAAIRQTNGAVAVGELILSNCEDASAILALQRLARDVGIFTTGPIPIVPLFESIAALEHAPAILDEVLSVPEFRAAIADLGNRAEIMIGYSDAAKDGGRLTADLVIRRALYRIAATLDEYAVVPVFFHGRGGSFGRGYAQPEELFEHRFVGVDAGEIKFTEQGETIARHYGDARLAGRRLDTLVFAGIHAGRFQASHPAKYPVFDELEQRLVAAGYQRFRALRDRPEFMHELHVLTPLAAVCNFPISSRPAMRAVTDEETLQLDRLRAIPLNVTFTAICAHVPAWYGTGTALLAEIDAGREGELRAAIAERPHLRFALHRAISAVGRSDLQVLELSAHVASDTQTTGRFVNEVIAESARLHLALHTLGIGADVEHEGRPIEQLDIRILACVLRGVFGTKRTIETSGMTLAHKTIAALAAGYGMSG